MPTNFRANDRVLLLAIPSHADLTAIARTVTNGVLVALGTSDEVDEARRAMAGFDNVMFVNASPQQIPWSEAYFSKILVPPHLASLLPHISGELHRVLAPGGEIIHSGVNA